ncbi:hypothetical protein [Streptomyces iranensis]|uniref:Lipoprotein n=1 Tax=Streptomyces iranensis TaxID=576784 RepID=A0A060ZZ31_9ACTN|nr:hypothetical protein [Streptomyces iranensis]MBP2066227.1 hypothetical protein [Streptomyces iranensis]CDR12965.1 predicted protein [Streptomyces iranensis]
MGRTLAVRIAVAVLATGAALTVTACSTEPEDKAPRVAGDQGKQEKKGKSRDQGAIAQAYAQCMSDQGQEVKVDEQGRIAVPAAGTGDDNAGGKQGAEAGDDLLKAMKKCDVKVPGMKQLRHKGDTERLKQARGLVDCLHKNGISDIPDPDPKDRGAISAPGNTMDNEKMAKAIGICGKKFPGVPFKAEQPK